MEAQKQGPAAGPPVAAVHHPYHPQPHPSSSSDQAAPSPAPTASTAAPMATIHDRNKRKSSGDPSPAPPRKRTAPRRVSWEDRLKELRAYKDAHGNLLIPIRYKLNPSLGKFVHNTREQYKLYHKQTPQGYKKKCSLTRERIDQLEALGFAWTTQRTKQQNEDWRARLEQLRAFKDAHGHCLVPHGYPEDPSFAEWIHRQRTSYNSMIKETGKVKPNPMLEQRFLQLKQMGFNFTVHSDKWMDHWRKLREYKEKHGDCQVPTHYAENQKLGRWVHTQRHQRRLQAKGKKSCMTQERIDLLDQLGFSWEVRPSLERPRATWQQRLEELEAFRKKHGHFHVDATAMPQLHAWCHEQCHRLKLLDQNNGKDLSKRMSPERAQALEAIGFTKDTSLTEAAKSVSMGMASPANMPTAATNTENNADIGHPLSHGAIPPEMVADTAFPEPGQQLTLPLPSPPTIPEGKVDDPFAAPDKIDGKETPMPNVNLEVAHTPLEDCNGVVLL